MRIGPIPVKLDNIGVLQPRQVIKDHLNLVLLCLEVLSLGELNLVPDDLYALLCVHGKVCHVDAGDVTLLDLEQREIFVSIMI